MTATDSPAPHHGAESSSARLAKRQTRAQRRARFIAVGVLVPGVVHVVLGLWIVLREIAAATGHIRLSVLERGGDFALLVLTPTAVLTGVAGIALLRSPALDSVPRPLIRAAWATTIGSLLVPVALALV